MAGKDDDNRMYFAPLPPRAIGDQRLTALHFRVLAALCLHDRMSGVRKAGQGCTAGNRRLAAECGCHYNNLSSAITDLGRWGYVEREVHPLNKRMRIYRVLYNGDDIAFTKAADSSSVDEVSRPSPEAIVREPTKPEGEIVRPHFKEGQQSQEDALSNIFRETDKILGEASERYSSEEASPSGDAICQQDKEVSNGALLAQFERVVLPAIQQLSTDDIKSWITWLAKIAENYDSHRGDPIGGRAQRLGEQLDEELYDRGFYDQDDTTIVHRRMADDDGTRPRCSASRPCRSDTDPRAVLAVDGPVAGDPWK